MTSGFAEGVAVRPENVVLHPACPVALPNLFRAKVIETTVFGSMIGVRSTLQCEVNVQWFLHPDAKMPDWLQGDVLVELPAAALQPLALPSHLRKVV